MSVYANFATKKTSSGSHMGQFPNTVGEFRGHVLIVEDDYFIAEEMRQAFQRAGAEVIGPVPTISEAVNLIGAAARVDAAVLDINLEGDGPVFPIADTLRARGVTFVFATGYDSGAIPERFADIKRFEKPCDPDQVLFYLAGGR